MKKDGILIVLLLLLSPVYALVEPTSQDGDFSHGRNNRQSSQGYNTESINSYLTYYGSGNINSITSFDLTFLESNNYNANEIMQIKLAGTIPVCYVTIGEDDVLHIGDGQGPGNYASWYLDEDNNNQPDQNPFWLSYYVNASNLLWQDYILNNVTELIINQKGCSGLFLDTIDTIDLYPSTKPGMLSLIQQLKYKYASKRLVANRGFSLLQEMAPYINGIMFESFSSSLVNNQYQAWTGQDKEWTSSWGLVLRELQQSYPIMVFALDYSNPTDQSLIDYDYNRALDYGFIPYVSTINLDNIYLHTFTRLPGNIPTGYEDSIGDVRSTSIDIIQLSAGSDDTTLTLSQQLAASYSSRAYYGVMIDTDFLESTGYKSNAIGADYLMEGNILYSYTGTGLDWSWQQIKTISFSQSNQQVSWQVNYNDVSSGQGRQLSFVFYAGFGNEQDTTVRGKYKTSGQATTTSSTSTSSTSTTGTSTVSTSSTSTSTSSSIQPTTILFIPTIAFDNFGREQISPDNGSLDGTVDISNNDARWLTNNNDYIQVNSWNNFPGIQSTITSATAFCEIDFLNPKSGNLVFSFNTGTGWQQACSQLATSPQTTYSCNLYSYGLDTAAEFQNILFRCSLSNSQQGAIGFSIDSINMQVAIQ